MASRKARKPNRAEKKLKRTHFKKKLPQHKNTDTRTILDVLTSSPGKGGVGDGCCTPKSQKSRIPEMLTCPPAPKKQRVPPNCTLRRRQIVFFAPPEIELFFVKANHQ
ncbi:hypothetical protein DY000_02049601 [Brassica cretica]|uniref:Uncharacterized protein n=1 Tax=Brassica cretica TaxID=69181 RepID=A0ABQ7F253_BRACR|nr:hypothetical protein DY000_02049601 [Brassica cretica]